MPAVGRSLPSRNLHDERDPKLDMPGGHITGPQNFNVAIHSKFLFSWICRPRRKLLMVRIPEDAL
jgi:hypothetical protein